MIHVQALTPVSRCFHWLRTPWLQGSSGAVGAALALAALLAGLAFTVLACKRGAPARDRWQAGLISGAFLLFALMHVLEGAGPPAPTAPIRQAAALGGMVVAVIFFRQVPRLLQASAPNLIQVLGRGKDEALDVLRQRESQLGRLIHEVREYAICFLDPRGRVVSWNQGAERITGWGAGEILGEPFSRFYPDEDVRAGKPGQVLDRARREGIFMEEGWRVRKDGSRYLASVTVTALLDGQGGVSGFSKVTRDITEARRAEERLQALAVELETKVRTQTAELRQSEARLRGFIQHAPVAIAFKGRDGRFLLINPIFEAFVGKPEAEILGRTLPELLPRESCRSCLEKERQVLERMEEVQSEEQFSWGGGPPRTCLAQRFPLVDGAGQCWGVGVIISDITMLKQAEQTHLQAQKLESLGILAGGLAHDFNNLLGAMAGNVELAQLVPASPEVMPFLDTLEGLIIRASGLVQQILAYAGRGRTEARALDLNRQAEETVRLLRSSLSRKAALQFVPDPALPPIQADPSGLQQAIMCLVFNAAEAVEGEEEGGIITVRTAQRDLDLAVVDRFTGQALQPGRYVVLEVADSGPGLAPEVLERIFDPFFTTKFAGRGLGLSAVLGTVRAQRGGIQVTSEPGRGSCFRLLFPAATRLAPEGPAAEPELEQEQAAADYRGAGTVLVVDDEESLRTAAARALQRIGFTTLEAGDGLEALRVFEANRTQIRLIVLDLTMPRMDGEEAYRALRSHGLLAPVILTSGFSASDVLGHFRSKGIAGFLQKPYRLQSLVQTIRLALAHEELMNGTGSPEPRKPPLATLEADMGCPMLDRQHLQLLQAFNHLVETVGLGGRRNQQERALTTLSELTLTHFGVEDTLMERIGYPRAREHQMNHARLIGQISDLIARIRDGSLSFTPALVDFLECWVVHHTQEDDRRLAQFLKGQGH
jgi:hemerythrin-like metal-binding protein/PAS domain S-box-containing protein